MRQIKILMESLKGAGKTIPPEDHIMHVLSGLGSEYESTISVITARKEISIQEVTSLLLSCESRIEKDYILTFKNISLPSANLVHQPNSSQSANDHSRFQQNQSYDNNRGRGRYNRGGGHQWNQRNRLQCQICYKFGHTADRCYFRIPNNSGNTSGRVPFSQ